MRLLIDKINRVLGFDLEQFILDFYDFCGGGYQDIIKFYSGKISVPHEAFNKLKGLKSRHIQLVGLLRNNKDISDSVELWDVVDVVDNIGVKLLTISATDKWSRSSAYSGVKSLHQSVDYVMKQNQTIELISKELGSGDPDNEWAEHALLNDVREEDYNHSGGAMLSVTIKSGAAYVEDVIDVMSGDSKFGKDICRKMSYVDDDLLCLTPAETVAQSIEILSNVKLSEIPEFKDMGVSKLDGGNRYNINYPEKFRQVSNSLLTDSVVVAVELLSAGREQDGSYMDLSIRTKAGDFVNKLIV